MNTYLGVICVKATPESYYDKPGYNVFYSNGYRDWLPQEIFESMFLKINKDDRLTQKDIDNWMGMSIVTTTDADERTTLVKVDMPSGFIEWEPSSCISAHNYNNTVGKQIALRHIEDRVWKMLGFVLQWGIHGIAI